MSRPTMMIDLQRCVGCMSCVVACKMENNVPVGIALNKVKAVGPVGTFPDLKQYYLPHACMHCDNPACVEVCPTGASIQREDGLVIIDAEACIGCEYCVLACPYGARSIDANSNKAMKCMLCQSLIDGGGKPSCVKHCMAYARFFGDLDDPGNDIARYLGEADNEGRAIRLLEEEGTKPTVAYLQPRCGMLAEEVPLDLKGEDA